MALALLVLATMAYGRDVASLEDVPPEARQSALTLAAYNNYQLATARASAAEDAEAKLDVRAERPSGRTDEKQVIGEAKATPEAMNAKLAETRVDVAEREVARAEHMLSKAEEDNKQAKLKAAQAIKAGQTDIQQLVSTSVEAAEKSENDKLLELHVAQKELQMQANLAGNEHASQINAMAMVPKELKESGEAARPELKHNEEMYAKAMDELKGAQQKARSTGRGNPLVENHSLGDAIKRLADSQVNVGNKIHALEAP